MQKVAGSYLPKNERAITSALAKATRRRQGIGPKMSSYTNKKAVILLRMTASLEI